MVRRAQRPGEFGRVAERIVDGPRGGDARVDHDEPLLGVEMDHRPAA